MARSFGAFVGDRFIKLPLHPLKWQLLSLQLTLMAEIVGNLERTELIEPVFEGDFVLDEPLELECGRALAGFVLHYAVYGEMSADRDNVVLVCHALSGSAQAGAWWPGLFVPGGIVDLSRECVVCVNLLGSCYGSTGPGSVDPETGVVYGPRFPLISIRDNVRSQKRLLDSLGVRRIKLAIGGSIGGMQALEWVMLFPDSVERAVVIAVAPLGALGLAMNHIQRIAITDDPGWCGGEYLSAEGASDDVRASVGPGKGLALARRIGMLSYKSPQLFEERFGRKPDRGGGDPWKLDEAGGGLTGGRFDVAGFLDYQGERFLERFDANAYLAIMRTMDTWDPVRGFESTQDAFGRIEAEVIFVGISSDWLFPPEDVRRLAEQVKAAGVRAEYREMLTDHGHDAFLAEQGELVQLLHLRQESA